MKNDNFVLLGNEEARQYLAGAISAGKLSHAYIFEGATGSGRKRLPAEYACSWLAASPVMNRAACVKTALPSRTALARTYICLPWKREKRR